MNRLLIKIAAALLCLDCAPLLAGPNNLSVNAIDALIASGKGSAPATRSGGWRVSGGFLHRASGDFDWNAGTMSTPSLVTIGLGDNYPGIDDIGPADAYADRTYLDGFVRLDGGTVDNGGDTWNWGYQNASQLSGSLLSMHGGDGRRSEFSASSDNDRGALGGELDGNAPFIEIAYMNPWRDNLSFGWQGAFMFLSTDSGGAASTFTAGRSRTDYGISYTDVFDLGIVIAPQAPYAGSITGPGPLLPNIPVSRTPVETVIGGETVNAFNSIRTDFDLNLSTLSFGPVLEYASGPWAFTGSSGFTVNFADWDVGQRETLYVSRSGAAPTSQNTWNHSRSGTEVLPGFYIQAAASRQITENWSLQVIGRYDWVADFDMTAGPSSGSADVSGWSLGAGLGFRF
jgi:hypothetical protein